MDRDLEREDREAEPSLAEVAETAVRRIATSIVIAAAAIALAIYARPGPPRYQAFATESGIVRIDTRKGTIVACEAGRCTTVLRRGQRPERAPKQPALPSPAPNPAAEPVPALQPDRASER